MKQRLMVVGLGYVGIQLAYAFSKSNQYEVVGFDIHTEKINAYKRGSDVTGEIGPKIADADIEWCDMITNIAACDIYIVTVPTPTENGNPVYTYVDHATKMIAEHMPKGALVVYESTYPPYTTEKRCVPLLEAVSGKKAFEDFQFAYSPERVNPGDQVNTLANVTKLVAGGSQIATEKAVSMYESIIQNVHPVRTIAVAEAAKIVENSQRDVNIALMNQFAMLYPDIIMSDMIEAMNTKWNALGFHNGLVGGHCVAEDPYYLIEQQSQKGAHFTLLEEARKVNEAYVRYVLKRILQWLDKDEDILFYGLTFKPDTPDVRNSKALALYLLLKQSGYRVFAVDPYQEEIEFDLQTSQVEYANDIQKKEIKTCIYSVYHKQFKADLDIAEVKKIIDLGGRLYREINGSQAAYFTI